MKKDPKTQFGFSLIEAIISVSILFSVGLSMTTSLGGLRQVTLSGTAQQRLQSLGEKAMTRIVSDLRRTANNAAAANLYPYIFEDGDAQAPFANLHFHNPAQHQAGANDFDGGPTREIVFVLPQDLYNKTVDPNCDGNPVSTPDGIPDTDGLGNLIWAPAELSYVLITGNDGINYVERRTNGGNAERIVPFVERMSFDMNSIENPNIPLDSVRIRLYFRMQTSDGLYKHATETTVKLDNTPEE